MMTSASGASVCGNVQSKNKLKDEQNLSEIVDRYAPLVKRIAHHLMGRLPPSVQADDLIQSGMIGLIEAAKRISEPDLLLHERPSSLSSYPSLL